VAGWVREVEAAGWGGLDELSIGDRRGRERGKWMETSTDREMSLDSTFKSGYAPLGPGKSQVHPPLLTLNLTGGALIST